MSGFLLKNSANSSCRFDEINGDFLLAHHIYICVFFVCVFTAILSGCTSDHEKLESICAEIHTASLMTNDCSEMAKYLETRTEQYNALISKLNAKEPDENKRLEYVDAVSVCLRNYLEISTGTCKDNPDVVAALPREMK